MDQIDQDGIIDPDLYSTETKEEAEKEIQVNENDDIMIAEMAKQFYEFVGDHQRETKDDIGFPKDSATILEKDLINGKPTNSSTSNLISVTKMLYIPL